MRTIVVDRTLRAPPEAVFDAIATPEGLRSVSRAVRGVELMRRGAPEPWGVGAVRRVDLGPAFLVEEVTAFERPRRFEYLIREARPSFTHHGGTLLLRRGPGGRTHARWRTSVSADAPFAEAAATHLLGVAVGVTLGQVLSAIDRHAGR